MRVSLKQGLVSLHYCASGGVARVYTAQTGGVRYAVKVMRRDLAQNAKVLAMFKREISILRTLSHKHVPQVVEFGFSIRPYYVYRYVDGQSVLHLLRHQRFPLDESSQKLIVRAFVELLELLDYLHRSKHTAPAIVHGDISPENLVLGHDRRITLIDFGSARISGEAPVGERSMGIGKPSYMSPEQAQGIPWDHRSDLYQVGVVFYEMLTGRKYIRAASAREAILIASTPPFMEARKTLGGMNAGLRIFLETILQPEPSRRYRSAIEAAANLAECL